MRRKGEGKATYSRNTGAYCGRKRGCANKKCEKACVDRRACDFSNGYEIQPESVKRSFSEQRRYLYEDCFGQNLNKNPKRLKIICIIFEEECKWLKAFEVAVDGIITDVRDLNLKSKDCWSSFVTQKELVFISEHNVTVSLKNKSHIDSTACISYFRQFRKIRSLIDVSMSCYQEAFGYKVTLNPYVVLK